VTAKHKLEYNWDAEKIRALRQHLEMTQQQMSNELGVRQQTVSDWELGYHRPRGGMARLLTIVAERADFGYETDPIDMPSDPPADE
jgi:DNA-binding transcriptional regulator YiaG